MKLNNKIKYGFICLAELSTDQNHYSNAEDIARRRNMPKAYAQKILQRMAQTGLVQGQKGMGYKLSRPLSVISALELINALSTEPGAGAFQSGATKSLEERIHTALHDIKLDQTVLLNDDRQPVA